MGRVSWEVEIMLKFKEKEINKLVILLFVCLFVLSKTVRERQEISKVGSRNKSLSS